MAEEFLLALNEEWFTCFACQKGTRFNRQEVKLVSTSAAVFDVDALSPIAEGAICVTCGYVHLFRSKSGFKWFIPDKEK
ncbi:hypothetical protein [Mycobacteroides abscessus]|uniref:hypothetical protein n=1 Tax=Mycobacteroides abscessus TaxID=36809 RepID=UPI00187862B5|nr:hypothetical protein [Mycobacteroides abscessus]MBE5438697.1 hypothetical protein [Mycobacteroides abscessus]